MQSSLTDRLTTVLARYKTPTGLFAAIWFWAGVAVYAGFIELPWVPDFVKHAFFWLGVAGNAIWWGYLNPKVDEKIAQRAAEDAERLPPSN